MDQSASKEVFVQQLIAASRLFLQTMQQFSDLNDAAGVHGFNQGGANQFVDSDFQVNNTHLSAQNVFDALFAIGNILGEVTSGQENALREVIPGGIP